MKKTLLAVVVMALGLSVTASALPAVTYDLMGCSYSTEVLLYKYDVAMAALESAGVPAEVLDDMEGLVGDGIPDVAQIMLLTSALCADAGLAAQFEANVDAYNVLIVNLVALVDWADGDPSPNSTTELLSSLATNLNDMAATLIAMGPPYDGYAPGIATLAGYVTLVVTDLVAEAVTGSDIADTIGALTMLDTPFAALGSLGTEMSMTLTALLGDLLAALQEPVEGVGLTPAQILAMVASNLDDAGAQLAGLGQTALAAQCAAGADIMEAGVLVLDALEAPTFVPVGATKLANEPFSGAGDYDGDGVTNLETWTIVGEGEAFVAAASGADPFYSGNPLLPAVGIVGLAALVSAFAAGGAFVLRKK